MRLRKNIILLTLLLTGFAGDVFGGPKSDLPAVINTGTNQYTDKSEYNITNTTISGSSTIVRIKGNLIVNGTLTVTGATLLVEGNLRIKNGGVVNVDEGAIVMVTGVVESNGHANLSNDSDFAAIGGLTGSNNFNLNVADNSMGNECNTYLPGAGYADREVLTLITNELTEILESANIDVPEALVSISPLPIELTYFVARRTSDGVKFEWQTASEKDNDYFTIEYSTDALNFSELATVSGAGTSTEIINYEYNYSTKTAGVMYYRLRQTDYDGQTECSDIVALSLAGHQTANVSNIDIKIYPNPATDYVQINGDGIVSVEFVNASGRVLSAAGQQASYSISNLPQGINYVIVHTTQGNAIRQFIKH